MTQKLKDKVAVITGGTRGFGFAIAQAYVREGAAVVVASRSAQSVEKAVQDLHAMGGQASGIPCDVGQREQVQALAQHAVDTFGKFDIWINNAGITAPYGPTMQIDPETFVNVIQTDILGVYFGSVCAMKHFLPKGAGKLINILGRGARQPVPLQNGYASSKAWVRSFTLALAKEYKDSGITIAAFNPGLMETDLMENIEVIAGYEDQLQPLETVMRMWGNPPEVPAETAVRLASSATDGRTGMEVRTLGLTRILSGLIGEAIRRLVRLPVPEREFNVRIVTAETPGNLC
jgi:glucose 1-dehydrogenase